MRYKTAQFRKQWNAAAKKEHRLAIDNHELHALLEAHHDMTGRRHMEMAAYEAKNHTTQTIEF